MNVYKLLLYLYPRAWRDRYGEEVLMILASRPLSFVESIDVLGGALDAHLHPRLGITGLSLAERARLMLLSLRGSLLTIFCAYVGFILAGLGFQKLAESATIQALAQRDPMIALSFQVILVGAIVALLAVLAGGLPIAVAVIRSALIRKRWGPLFLLAVPAFAFIVFFMVIVFLETAHPGSQSSERQMLYGCLLLGTLLAAAIVSAGAVCSAVARSEIPESLLRFAVLPSILTTGTMALILVSTIVWGLGLRASAPQIFSGYQGIVRTSTMGTWLGIVIAMAGATVLAVLFSIRSLSAYSVLRKTAA